MSLDRQILHVRGVKQTKHRWQRRHEKLKFRKQDAGHTLVKHTIHVSLSPAARRWHLSCTARCAAPAGRSHYTPAERAHDAGVTCERSSGLTNAAPRAVANTPALLHRFSRSAPLNPLVAAAVAVMQSCPTLPSRIGSRWRDKMSKRAASGGGGTSTQRSSRPCLHSEVSRRMYVALWQMFVGT